MSQKITFHITGVDGVKTRTTHNGQAAMALGFPMSLDTMKAAKANFDAFMDNQIKMMEEDNGSVKIR